jgi:hypothetical protein
VIQTRVLTEKDAGKLERVLRRPEFNFWRQPRVGRPADIMVSPEHSMVLNKILHRLNLNPTILIEDVGE